MNEKPRTGRGSPEYEKYGSEGPFTVINDTSDSPWSVPRFGITMPPNTGVNTSVTLVLLKSMFGMLALFA